jgi:hypothetical protein
VQVEWARWLAARGEDGSPRVQRAVGELDELLQRRPDAAAAWLARGDARLSWAELRRDPDRAAELRRQARRDYLRARELDAGLGAQVDDALRRCGAD